MTTLLIIWLLFGVLYVWCMRHTFRNEWYKEFKCEYWRHPCETALKSLLVTSPISIFAGPLGILSILLTHRKHFTFYFKIPKK